MLTLQVLGDAGAGPYRGSACTGHLVSTGRTRILIDCGPGVATALSREPIDLAAIFITHLHADHVYDLIPIAMSLRVQTGVSTRRLFSPVENPEARMPTPIPVYMRPGGREMIRSIESHFAVGSAAPFDTLTGGLLEFRELSGTEPVVVGDLRIEPFPVRHSIPAVGLNISDGKTRLAFTADTGLFDGLVEACTGADAILSESSLIDAPSQKHHMSARDAGALAKRAGVDLLILTHFVEPGADAEARAMAAAREQYSGRLFTTVSTRVFTLGGA